MENISVLIVDDIILNRILLSEIVIEIGAECSEASNGKEAIEKIVSNDYDIVLMDIEMPVMNGFETTKYIRTQLPEPKASVPVIAITAHDPNFFFEEYQNIGFDRLITKPYTVRKILRLFEELSEGDFNKKQT